MIKYRIIASIYRRIAKPFFFKRDPESVHDSIKTLGKFLGNFPPGRWITSQLLNYRSPFLQQTIAGLHFPNPVGLAAGFDKNAELLNILPAAGFGFAETGSVTMHPYSGNPKPRLYRLPKSQGLVVYYGLMNKGVRKIVNKLKQALKTEAIIGVSVAKTNSPETATEAGGIKDYIACLQYLEKMKTGDYYTINISCPNTFGGEPFTTPPRLDHLLDKIALLQIKKPVFIKMPVNLPLKEFDRLLRIIIKYRLTGVIIGNLTKIRDPKLIKDTIPEKIQGGISGKPTEALSNKLISYTYKKYGNKLIIIGVGGVFSAEDAYEKIKRGASLIQLITGMVFQGPQLIGQINYGLTKLLKQNGFRNINEAIGSANQ